MKLENKMIPQVKVPTFSMTLPVSKETVEFRPFLVKEEKLLLMAKDSKDSQDINRAIIDTVKSCTFNIMNAENYSLADLQYAFLHIRGKSIGEEMELQLLCGNCKSKTIVDLSIHDFEVINEKVNNKIVMNDITITLKMPNIYHYTKLLVDNDDLINATFDVIADCIDTIYSDEEAFQNTPELKNDVIEFLNNLPADQFEKLEDFFSTMPLLYKEFKFQCNECSHNNELRIDSISSFF
jgi:hypothetical protein